MDNKYNELLQAMKDILPYADNEISRLGEIAFNEGPDGDMHDDYEEACEKIDRANKIIEENE